jgi:hypothetical protein
MADIYAHWEHMRGPLQRVLNEANPQLPEIQMHIEELQEINQRYMQLVAKRYYEEVVRLGVPGGGDENEKCIRAVDASNRLIGCALDTRYLSRC